MADKRVKIIEQQIENESSFPKAKHAKLFHRLWDEWVDKEKEKFCLVCLRDWSKRMKKFKRNCKYYFITENDKNNFKRSLDEEKSLLYTHKFTHKEKTPFYFHKFSFV